MVWKPSAFEAKDFKVNDVNGCSLTADRKRIQAKREVLIEDFKFILKDYYLRLGSVESVKAANENQNKLNGNISNAKRYFTKPNSATNKEKVNSSPKHPKPVIAKNNKNKKLAKVLKAKQPKKTKLKVKPSKKA